VRGKERRDVYQTENKKNKSGLLNGEGGFGYAIFPESTIKAYSVSVKSRPSAEERKRKNRKENPEKKGWSEGGAKVRFRRAFKSPTERRQRGIANGEQVKSSNSTLSKRRKTSSENKKVGGGERSEGATGSTGVEEKGGFQVPTEGARGRIRALGNIPQKKKTRERKRKSWEGRDVQGKKETRRKKVGWKIPWTEKKLGKREQRFSKKKNNGEKGEGKMRERNAGLEKKKKSRKGRHTDGKRGR